jgi:high-affinity Fe2+/Pb2+ permease
MKLLAVLLELAFFSVVSGGMWVLLKIPFAKAGPFSLIIIGALGFSLICVVQSYVHLLEKYELPLGSSFIGLFVGRPSLKLQKSPIHHRSSNNRR